MSGEVRARGGATMADVRAALSGVVDPELGLSIVDLGLVYGVTLDEDDRVTVTMTLTARGCPLHEVMTDWVRAAVGTVRGVRGVDVVVTFDPPWTPDLIRTPGTLPR